MVKLKHGAYDICKDCRINCVPVYLRDLKDGFIHEAVSRWKKDKKEKLLRAYKNGDEIIVGYYLKYEKVEG